MSDTQVIARPVVNRVIVRSPGPPGPPGSSELTTLDLAQLRDTGQLATATEGQTIVRQGSEWVPTDPDSGDGLYDPLGAAEAAVEGLASTTDLNAGLATKANSADVTAALAAKANTTDVTAGLAAKASTTDLNAGLATKVGTSDARLTDKRVSPDNSVTPAQLTFDPATQTELDGHTGRTDNPHATTKAQVGLSNVDNTSDTAKPISTATQSALNAKADLVGGKVPTSQLPAIAIGESFPVASQAAMLALTAQIGDVAVRSDQGNTKYMLLGTDPALLGNWTALGTTGGAVQSVNGQDGIVVLGKADVGLGNVDNTADASKPVSTAQSAALAAKQPLDADLSAIAALDSATAGVLSSTGGGWIRQTYAQVKTALGLTKADVGLGSVDNTSDVNKPVSTAAQAALDNKQNADPDLTAIAGLDSTVAGVVSTDGSGWVRKTYAQLKTSLGLSKADVGLGNVDNTSDANKPVSAATQTALDAKADAAATTAALAGKASSAAAVPAGGATGQVLSKTGTGDYALGWSTPAGAAAAEADLISTYLRPTGAFRETFSRMFASGSIPHTSDRSIGTAVVFRAGEVVTGITLHKNTASATQTHLRYYIGQLSGDGTTMTILAITPDDTTASIPINTPKRLALSSPWTCPATGVYYVGAIINATTTGTWYGNGIPNAAGGSPRIGYSTGVVSSAAVTPTLTIGSTIDMTGNSSVYALYAAFD